MLPLEREREREGGREREGEKREREGGEVGGEELLLYQEVRPHHPYSLSPLSVNSEPRSNTTYCHMTST